MIIKNLHALDDIKLQLEKFPVVIFRLHEFYMLACSG